MQQGPPPDVLDAFAATTAPVLLDGGRGRTWRSGDLVLKPVDHPDETEWRAELLTALPENDAFRVARPVRTRTGQWTTGGWEAANHVAGHADPKRWNDAIEAGAAFHQAIAGLPRPAFLDDRDDWWTRADRDSWDPELAPAEPILRDLAAARTPVAVEHQLVHGDLTGNVLYEPGLPPAIIDWPPYWRPASWAAAVVAVDAMCWNGADATALDRWAGLEAWPQMTVRALLFRLMSDQNAAAAQGRAWEPHPAYRPVADAVLERAHRH